MLYSLSVPLPTDLAHLGFSPSLTGEHMARSFMIKEPQIPHQSAPSEAPPSHYKLAVEEQNLRIIPLGKRDKAP